MVAGLSSEFDIPISISEDGDLVRNELDDIQNNIGGYTGGVR